MTHVHYNLVLRVGMFDLLNYSVCSHVVLMVTCDINPSVHFKFYLIMCAV